MGDTIKEGAYKLVRVDKPITNEMKAECIGEFSFQTEEPEFDEDGEYTGELYWKTHVVPWDTCKVLSSRPLLCHTAGSIALRWVFQLKSFKGSFILITCIYVYGYRGINYHHTYPNEKLALGIVANKKDWFKDGSLDCLMPSSATTLWTMLACFMAVSFVKNNILYLTN